MSYERIKAILIVADRVIIRSTGRDDEPGEWREWEAERLTEIYRQQGLKAVEKEILYNFFSGDFIGGERFPLAVHLAKQAELITDCAAIWAKCRADEAYKDRFTEILYGYLDCPVRINDPKPLQTTLF